MRFAARGARAANWAFKPLRRCPADNFANDKLLPRIKYCHQPAKKLQHRNKMANRPEIDEALP